MPAGHGDCLSVVASESIMIGAGPESAATVVLPPQPPAAVPVQPVHGTESAESELECTGLLIPWPRRAQVRAVT